MLAGFPGTFARNGDCIITNRIRYASDTGTLAFGDPVLLRSDNTFTKMQAGGTMAAFAGVAVREVKQFTTSFTAQSNGSYAPGDPTDVIERGPVSVVCNVGTPVAGGAVYVRITANGAIPAGVVGGFEYRTDDDDDDGKCILITNAKWATGLIDANKVAELTLLSRNLP
jgi:hypothetical protein